MSKITRDTKTAVNMLINKPRISVTAKPLIWSVPTTYSTIAVISVVTFESMIVAMAREKPLRIAMRSEAPRSSFLAHSFVDQHVGVDGHADGQHQARQARQREGRLDQDHQGHGDQHVQASRPGRPRCRQKR